MYDSPDENQSCRPWSFLQTDCWREVVGETVMRHPPASVSYIRRNQTLGKPRWSDCSHSHRSLQQSRQSSAPTLALCIQLLSAGLCMGASIASRSSLCSDQIIGEWVSWRPLWPMESGERLLVQRQSIAKWKRHCVEPVQSSRKTSSRTPETIS
jgi:DNA-binding transcriptional LysR family regulator